MLLGHLLQALGLIWGAFFGFAIYVKITATNEEISRYFGDRNIDNAVEQVATAVIVFALGAILVRLDRIAKHNE